jgi:uncharacterized protein (TIGR02453 family)
MLHPSTLKFLKDLKKHNNKPWFDAHRIQYEAARKDFTEFVQAVIDKHGKKDPTINSLTARDCLFRVNRDVRFAKDKSPYKTNFGASINKGGKKAFDTAGYYFHLEPGASFSGGGLYMPMSAALGKVRQEIDYNLPQFKKILNSKKFRSVYDGLDISPGLMLSRVPKGYKPDDPAAEFLKYKSYIAFVNLSDKELVSPDLVKKTVASFAAIQPLLEFLNEAM